MDGIEWARAKYNYLGKTWCKMMEGFAMYTSSRIICDAEAVYEVIRKRHRRRPPHSVIEYGAPLIDDSLHTDILEHYGIKEREYYLIVCRMEPENHVTEILKGFAASDSKLPLIILGNVSAETPYVKELLTIKDPRIRFVGTLFEHEKLQHLRRASLAYFHGHSVGGTNPSLIEALGCGNVVVAHDNEFNREVAAESAFYFGDFDSIPEIINKIENDDSVDLEAMRRGAKKRIADHYTWEIITDKYLKLLESYKK